jgi:hypothetical protein
MIRDFAIIRESAGRVARAANETLTALREGRIEQEPDFTSNMIGRIETAMDGFVVKGVKWTAKVLTDRGPNAQERRFGADFVGVLEINLSEYSVKKGFLVQAKKIAPEQSMATTEFGRMREQCQQMLAVSPESYVFLYSHAGIAVVPALTVVSLSHADNPHRLYSRSVSRFYEEHFECFVGDPKIYAPSIHVLDEIVERAWATRVLSLLAE